jgi:hypothetical protein
MNEQTIEVIEQWTVDGKKILQLLKDQKKCFKGISRAHPTVNDEKLSSLESTSEDSRLNIIWIQFPWEMLWSLEQERENISHILCTFHSFPFINYYPQRTFIFSKFLAKLLCGKLLMVTEREPELEILFAISSRLFLACFTQSMNWILSE